MTGSCHRFSFLTAAWTNWAWDEERFPPWSLSVSGFNSECLNHNEVCECQRALAEVLSMASFGKRPFLRKQIWGYVVGLRCWIVRGSRPGEGPTSLLSQHLLQCLAEGSGFSGPPRVCLTSLPSSSHQSSGHNGRFSLKHCFYVYPSLVTLLVVRIQRVWGISKFGRNSGSSLRPTLA